MNVDLIILSTSLFRYIVSSSALPVIIDLSCINTTPSVVSVMTRRPSTFCEHAHIFNNSLGPSPLLMIDDSNFNEYEWSICKSLLACRSAINIFSLKKYIGQDTQWNRTLHSHTKPR